GQPGMPGSSVKGGFPVVAGDTIQITLGAGGGPGPMGSTCNTSGGPGGMGNPSTVQLNNGPVVMLAGPGGGGMAGYTSCTGGMMPGSFGGYASGGLGGSAGYGDGVSICTSTPTAGSPGQNGFAILNFF
ncbi:MAG: hypothetical protein ACXWOH_06170, partial [Bdellovibrionota bacterium]